MDREVLLAHLRRTRHSSEGRERARSDARRIASFLLRQGARRVIGFGSAFVADRRFTAGSDLDLAVEGLPPARYFEVLARAQELTDLELDLVPLEAARDHIREAVRSEGVPL